MKFKPLSLEYIKISLDRLTRFKPVAERYERVFDDILNKHLLYDGFKISELSLKDKIKTATEIFNSNLTPSSFELNEILKKDEERVFYLTEEDKMFLDSKINFEGALELFKPDELPLNLKRLKLQKNETSDEVRKKHSTLFPVSKVVLVEGITEEILLIEFARVLGLDFKKEGIYVLGAGGKNQAARKYYKLIEEIKIPIFVLLDFDAESICDLISPKLRDIDVLYKIKSGEFEDILPKNLIKNALDFHFKEALEAEEDYFEEGHAVVGLNNYYKNNGLGDFKKSAFAKIIRDYLQNTENPPVSLELKLITEKIKSI